MIVGRSPTSIGQIWRAVQQTSIVSCSINSSQISYARSTLGVKKMSHPGDQSMEMRGPKRMQAQKSVWRPVKAQSNSLEGHKRMKVQKSVWRPVNIHLQSSEGKENEDMDTQIRTGEREYSSVADEKNETIVNDSKNLSDNNVATISGVQTSVTSISRTPTSSQDVQSEIKTMGDLQSSTKSIKSYISVKHVRSEASVKCIMMNQEGVVDPVTMANLEDASSSEQMDSLSETEASILSVNKNEESVTIEPRTIDYEKENEESVIVESGNTDYEKDTTEDKQQQSNQDIDVNNLQSLAPLIESSATDYEKDTAEDKQQQNNQVIDVKNLQNCIPVEESVETKMHSRVVKVDTALLRFIKGKGGKEQKKIEDATGVKISYISTDEEATIVLDGPSAESVTTATATIQKILDKAVKGPSLQYSHFVSLPLAFHLALIEKLTNFQKSVLGLCGSVVKEVNDSESASNAESSDEGSEDLYEGKDVTVNLNVEDDNEHVKVEILERPIKNELSQSPKSFAGVDSNTAHPADEISDEKDVAVKLDVEDGNVHVKLEVEGNSVGHMQAKRKIFYSQTKKNRGIDKSIFIKPVTFHLTVLMLKLWNKERVDAAADVLKKVSPQVKEALEGRPIAVSLKGLKLMRGNPAKAHVLYAPVEEVGGGGRLERACRVIIDAFVEAGLVLQRDATSTLKLHATLMNTTHRKKMFNRYKRNFPFDARRIIELYGSEDWGEYVIPEIHLSQRFKYDNNGYYHCCASIPFPEICKETLDVNAETTNEAARVTAKAKVSDEKIHDGTAKTIKEVDEMTVQETAEVTVNETDEEPTEEIGEQTDQEIAKENAKRQM